MTLSFHIGCVDYKRYGDVAFVVDRPAVLSYSGRANAT